MQMGFFAEAGPVQVFVSNHLIPQDFAFASTDEPCFVSGDEAVRIIQGAEVRLRIVGTRVDATEIVRWPSFPHSGMDMALAGDGWWGLGGTTVLLHHDIMA